MKRYVTALLGIGAAAALTLSMGAAVASASTASAARPSNTGSCGTACPDITFVASGSHWTQVDYYGRTSANNQINLQARTDTNSTEDWYPTGEGTIFPDVLRYADDRRDRLDPHLQPVRAAVQGC